MNTDNQVRYWTLSVSQCVQLEGRLLPINSLPSGVTVHVYARHTRHTLTGVQEHEPLIIEMQQLQPLVF